MIFRLATRFVLLFLLVTPALAGEDGPLIPGLIPEGDPNAKPQSRLQLQRRPTAAESLPERRETRTDNWGVEKKSQEPTPGNLRQSPNQAQSPQNLAPTRRPPEPDRRDPRANQVDPRREQMPSNAMRGNPNAGREKQEQQSSKLKMPQLFPPKQQPANNQNQAPAARPTKDAPQRNPLAPRNAQNSPAKGR